MRALSAFTPWVAPHAVSASDPYIEQAVRDACISLCEETSIIQTVESYDVVKGQSEYSIVVPPQQQVASIIAVTFDQYPLPYVTIDEVNHGAAMRAPIDIVVDPTRGKPTSYYQAVPSSSFLYLWPVPDEDYASLLAVRAAFAPTRSATQVEDALFEEWLPVIVDGALASLLSTPSMPFTNLPLSEYYKRRFELAKGSAKRKSRVGAGRSRMAVKFVSF